MSYLSVALLLIYFITFFLQVRVSIYCWL